MKKMQVWFTLGLLILALPLFAAGSREAAVGRPALRVAVMPSAVGAPVQYAYEQGWFQEEDLNIEIVIFPNGAVINEAVAARQLDIAASGAATIFSLATGTNSLIADVASSGGMGIWVRPNSRIMTARNQISGYPEIFGSADTIRGTRFLATLGTASHYNVLRYIERFGLSESDVEIIHMEFGAAAQAFIANQGDAIATFAPYSFQVMERANAVMATSFEDATQTALYDMLFVRNEILNARRSDVVAFMRVFQRAVEALADDNVRREFSMRWFAENGRTYTDETMTQEMIDRRYVTREVLSGDSFVLGEAIPEYARFNVGIGRIESENLRNVEQSIDPSVWAEAVGIPVRGAGTR